MNYEQAKKHIERVQEENRGNFNHRRNKIKKPNSLQDPNYYSYKISNVLGKDRYEMVRNGDGGGPGQTSSSVDHMKSWPASADKVVDSEDEESRMKTTEFVDDDSEEEFRGFRRRSELCIIFKFGTVARKTKGQRYVKKATL